MLNNPPYKVPCRSSFGAKGCLHPRPEHPSTTHKSAYFTAPRLAFKSKPKHLRPSKVRPCALAGRHMAKILVFYGILRSAMKSQSRTLATYGPPTSDPVTRTSSRLPGRSPARLLLPLCCSAAASAEAPFQGTVQLMAALQLHAWQFKP